MIYVDANVFIYPVLYHGKKAAAAKEILRQIIEGRKAVTSCLTVDEVTWKIWMESSRDQGITEGERLLFFPNLKVVQVKPRDTLYALNLMKEYQEITPRDAIHLSTALERNIHTIVSDDQDFDYVTKIKRVKLD